MVPRKSKSFSYGSTAASDSMHSRQIFVFQSVVVYISLIKLAVLFRH